MDNFIEAKIFTQKITGEILTAPVQNIGGFDRIIFITVLPATGEVNVLYVDKLNRLFWIWDGSGWDEIGGGGSVSETDPIFSQWLMNHPDLVQDSNYVHTDNNYTDADAQTVANTSGTNTGDQDLTPYLLKDTTLQTADTPELTSLFSFWKIGVGRVKIAWNDLLNTISHNQLNGLDWLSSGHTGAANTVAGFDGSGVAKEYALTDFSSAKEKRHAFVSGTSYCGTAPAGTAESATIWTLTKIVVAANGTTIVTHATDSWTNHLTSNYQ